MNIIKTKVDFTKGTCTVSGINLVEGDYNSTKIEFTFDREDGTKVFEMKSPSEQLVAYQEIYNNEIILYGLKDVTTEHNSKTYTKYTKNDAIYWYQPTDNKLFTDAWVEVVTFDLTEYTKATEKASIFTEEGNYIFEISLYEDDSKLTSASGKIKVKAEQVKIDDNMVTPYIPIFDELMQDVETALGNIEDKITEVNTAITQTNNLDLDVSKSGKVATVTLTKKDNTTKTVTLSDGTSLQFNWDGTKLGVKTDNDESYTYVDLKGETGETGATPSLSIGTVSTGSPSAVTITGTDENPVLNFTLEKGETGATGATGNGIASIVKTSTSGTVDTYTITYTDGTTTTFNVTNGEVSQAQLDELQAQVDRYKLIENALPHITGTGTELTLNNTANAGMTIDLEPNTSQETTTGKQLFNKSQTPIGTGNATITVLNTGLRIAMSTTAVTGFASFKVGGSELLGKTLSLFSTITQSSTNTGRIRLFYGKSNSVAKQGIDALYSTGSLTFTVLNEFPEDCDGIYALFYATLNNEMPSGVYTEFTDLIIKEGSSASASDYEPYTNGASPNPDYPQDIHVVSGDNTLKVENKNLFDKATITTGKMINKNTGNPDNDTGTNCSDYIDVSKFANVILSGATISYSNGGAFYDSAKTYVSGFSSSALKNGLAVPNNAVYIRFNMSPVDVDTTMLQSGTTATPYEPHEEQVVNILLGDIEYCKIGDYKDEFYMPSGKNLANPLLESGTINTSGQEQSDSNARRMVNYIYFGNATTIYFKRNESSVNLKARWYDENKTFVSTSPGIGTVASATLTPPSNARYLRLCIDNNNDNYFTQYGVIVSTENIDYEPYGTDTWYLKKNIGKAVFTGASSENWSKYLLSFNGNFPQASSSSLCSHFVDAGTNWTSSDETYRGKYSIKNSLGQFKCMPLEDMTLEEFKTWLGTHNVIVYYVLETPTYTLLNNTLQNALNTLQEKLLAYKGQTNITQVNNDLPFEIVASALKDISNL